MAHKLQDGVRFSPALQEALRWRAVVGFLLACGVPHRLAIACALAPGLFLAFYAGWTAGCL